MISPVEPRICQLIWAASHSSHQYWQVVAVFDEIWADQSIIFKQRAFTEDSRTKGTAYTTAHKWTKPEERVRIATAASKEHRQSLLRIDKVPDSRRVGKYPDMEKEVFRLMKEKRARGWKVSARWVSSTARQVMKTLKPGVHFAATFAWRQRWRRRFNINPSRRKSNCKNKSFADSEPVLQRYFQGLRRRLQLDVPDDGQVPDDGEESEPEDLNPEREEGDAERNTVGGDFLDSSDDEVDEAQLISFENALVSQMRVAPPPSTGQLEFKNTIAKELKDRVIMYN